MPSSALSPIHSPNSLLLQSFLASVAATSSIQCNCCQFQKPQSHPWLLSCSFIPHSRVLLVKSSCWIQNPIIFLITTPATTPVWTSEVACQQGSIQLISASTCVPLQWVLNPRAMWHVAMSNLSFCSKYSNSATFHWDKKPVTCQCSQYMCDPTLIFFSPSPTTNSTTAATPDTHTRTSSATALTWHS